MILVVGVNGTGKTTTIGKLAQKLREHGRSVLVGAADTFDGGRRAARDLGRARRCRFRRLAARHAGQPLSHSTRSRRRGRVATTSRSSTPPVASPQTNLMAELEKVRRSSHRSWTAAHETLSSWTRPRARTGSSERAALRRRGPGDRSGADELDGSARGGSRSRSRSSSGCP